MRWPILCILLLGLAIQTAQGAERSPRKLSEVSIYSDLKAHRVGDIVRVKIVESASAFKEASAKTSRTSGKKGLLNLPWLRCNSFFIRYNPFSKGVDLSSETSFSGSGSISTKGEFRAEVTAVVKEVLPNGNLLIEGRREISIDGEKQVIYVKGIVRPQDISPDNVVLSIDLADSEIRYEGKGMVSRQKKPGFLSRLLDWLWIF